MYVFIGENNIKYEEYEESSSEEEEESDSEEEDTYSAFSAKENAKHRRC